MANNDVKREELTLDASPSYDHEESVEFKGKMNKLMEHSHDVDEAARAFAGREGEVIVIDDITNKRLLKKIDQCLLPLMCVVCGLNFLDKTTISYASAMGLNKDLHLVGNNYNWLGSVFYIGYLFWEYPTSRFLQRMPLSKYLSVSIILWGITLACLAAVRNFTGAVAVRLLLGVGEASVTPGFALLTSQWYTQREQSTRMGIWYSFNGLAQIFGGLLAYGINRAVNTYGSAIEAWRVLFLVTGLLTVVVGVIFYFVMPDNQLNAIWLSPEDRILAVERVRVNNQGIGNKHFKFYQVKEAFTDPLVWGLAFFGFVGQLPGGGLGVFFSQLIVSFGYTPEQSLYYATPAGAVLAISLFANGWLGSRYCNRLLISTSGLWIAMLGVLLIMFIPTDNPKGRLTGYFLAYTSSMPFVTLLSIISSNIAGYTKKTTVAALYFMCYCGANITAPQTFRPADAPQYRPAQILMLCCLASCIVDLIYIWWYLKRQNAKKAAIRALPGYMKLENQEWLDLTDRENPEFVYAL